MFPAEMHFVYYLSQQNLCEINVEETVQLLLPLVLLNNYIDRFGVSTKFCLFPEIMTQLSKIFHRPWYVSSYVGTVFFTQLQTESQREEGSFASTAGWPLTTELAKDTAQVRTGSN